MKKILIVDDNLNNRMLIRALIEDYCEDNNEEVSIHEAVNGLEASLMAEDNRFSLIFMDIMMPEMDGIEATIRIRAVDPKTMIIAVSAVDDGERQRQILSCGAEDYIPKPINSDIFTARLGNYFSLMHSRENVKHRFSSSAANLFSTDIFSRKLLFYVQNDDDLSEFWEYYLLNQGIGSEPLSSGVRTLYAVGAIAIKLGGKSQIIVEESDESIYMTMTGMDQIDGKILKLILLKNPDVKEYKIQDDKLSIQIPHPHENREVPAAEPAKKSVEPLYTPHAAVKAAAGYVAPKETLQVYNYMDHDDLEDLKEYVGKLNTLMLVVGSEIEAQEVEEIADNLQRISQIASGYTDSYTMSQALAGLGRTIGSHRVQFMVKSDGLAPMCKAFGRDLSSWIRLIFVEGATSVNYMDDTIVANAQMIESILTMDDSSLDGAEENLDNIFDF